MKNTVEEQVTGFLGREEFPKTRFRATRSWPPASPASGPAMDRKHRIQNSVPAKDSSLEVNNYEF